MVAWERCRSGRGGEAALGPVAVSGKGVVGGRSKIKEEEEMRGKGGAVV